MENNKNIVQVAAECLDVLLLLCLPEFQRLSLNAISETMTMGKSKTYRLLNTLESRHLVRKKGECWEAAPEIVKIADGYRRHITKKRMELEAQYQEYLGE